MVFYKCSVATHRCLTKKVFLKISKMSQENLCRTNPFFNKVTGLRVILYLKRSQCIEA